MKSKALKQRKFLEAYVDSGANKELAATKSGVSISTAYRWFREDEEFRKTLSETFTQFEQLLFEEAFRRAMNGSDTLLIFLLKAANPLRYCEAARRAELQRKQEKEELPMRVEQVVVMLPDGESSEAPFPPYSGVHSEEL